MQRDLPMNGASSALRLATAALLVYCLLAFLRSLLTWWRGPQRIAHLPGPGIQHWFLGSFPTQHIGSGKFASAISGALDAHGRVLGVVNTGRQPIIVCADHTAAAQILLKTPWSKAPDILELTQRHVSTALVGATGEAHKRHRRVAHPAFSSDALTAQFPDIIAKAVKLEERITRMIDAGAETIDMLEEFSRMGMDIVGKIAINYEFGVLDGNDNDPLYRAHRAIMASLLTGTPYAVLRFALGKPVEALGRALRIREQLELDHAKHTIRVVGRELVSKAQRRARGLQVDDEAKGTDLLSLMVGTNEGPDLKPGQKLSDDELVETVPTLFFAGHETSATTLAWACWALTQPGHGLERQRRLRRELAEAQGSWKESLQEMDALPYLDAVVREILRIHSPIASVIRVAAEDSVLPLGRPYVGADGKTSSRELFVPKGVQVYVPIVQLNTDEEIWADGRSFRPERWLDASHPLHEPELGGTPRISGLWSSILTFGQGPMNCIGSKIGVLQVKAGLAALLSSYELEMPLGPGEEPLRIDGITGIITQPAIAGQQEKGPQMPIRLRKRPEG
ncbi:hypothetical protein OC835_001154 [Tilletia horrida]|nr:hypothetical protein OC835_001154 [Tilletia horrida]